MTKSKNKKETKSKILFNSGDNASYLASWVKKTLYSEKQISTHESHLDICWSEYWKKKQYWGDHISGICGIDDYAMAQNRKPLTIDDITKAKALLKKLKPQKKLSKIQKMKQKFIDLMLPAARESKKKYGVPISVTLAQAAEETGWGRSVKNNNYFGIKGKGKPFTTHEVMKGKRIKVKPNFRLYKSVEESVLDHGKLLSSNPRYQKLFKHKDDPFRFCDELKKAGYASEPGYANHLKGIIKGNKLYEYDDFKF
ncbi:MAG: glucosaminidase domain-containing protein [Deltaproteobacteria bacterium]|nr:glucosaminidase domain-containing protein [Deltaproteobacteria bacterium]